MIKIKFTLLIAVCSLFTGTLVHAQDNIVTVPPSPEAAHLSTYGDLSVSKANGTADVSIPITTIQEGGITIPVSLSYQSVGMRVNEQPSWVGMGWVLNGGGVITRIVRGKCDDMHNGFLHNALDIPNEPKIRDLLDDLSGANDDKLNQYEFLKHLSSGNEDYVPDIFSFNFPGHGGSFFLGNEGNAHVVDYNGLVKLKLLPLRFVSRNNHVSLYKSACSFLTAMNNQSKLYNTISFIQI